MSHAEGALFHLAVAVAAFLYSAVGHGGASAYLAILACAGAERQSASMTALMLNILVSGTSLAFFAQARYLRGRVLVPFLIGSIPLAIIGSKFKIGAGGHNALLALALTFAAYRLWNHGDISGTESQKNRKLALLPAVAIGAVIGFVSGAIGIGGGVFLSPILILRGWAQTKETSAASAGFIFTNSIAALITRFFSGAELARPELTLAALAFAGGLLGSWAGARHWDGVFMRRILSLVLGFATIKLVQGVF
ncbi:MAG: sulfite exporter TauE/SafE family protein [Elusimicrobia bacterium]|nr:sulfite exporter TauE/SafE family protein [Elusimicrobiota bacterium]